MDREFHLQVNVVLEELPGAKDLESCLLRSAAAMTQQRMPFEASNAIPCQLPEITTTTVAGYDFNHGLDLRALLHSFASTGFQAAHLAQAIVEVNRMLDWRLSDEPIDENTNDGSKDPEFRKGVKCKIFLGCTSNMISSGVRETIRFLVEHKMVDVLVTTAGGVEEDLIKCLAPTVMGDFALQGVELRSKGLNRIGNLLMPNENYRKFENWVVPILDQLLVEQKHKGTVWTPTKVIARLGKEIDHPDSICYWAQKNNIPIYCPALTDGALGDMLYSHSFRNPGLVIDIVQDIRGMNGEAVNASPRKTGIIILGGGVPKHHICNANSFRDGADFAVYINTAQEYDGSDSGARPDEAVSWGKIRGNAKAVKVHCDATIAFPILVSQTFVPRVKSGRMKREGLIQGNEEVVRYEVTLRDDIRQILVSRL